MTIYVNFKSQVIYKAMGRTQMNEKGKTLEELLEKVKDENKWRRASAAGGLGRFQDVQAVKTLIVVLGDHDSDVRWAAVRALSEIGELAVEPLIQALKDEDSYVRRGAAKALGMIGDLQAVEPLIDALPDKEDYWVRTNAAEALGMIGDIQAIEPLEHLLQIEKREWVIEVVEKALEQLKQKQEQ